MFHEGISNKTYHKISFQSVRLTKLNSFLLFYMPLPNYRVCFLRSLLLLPNCIFFVSHTHKETHTLRGNWALVMHCKVLSFDCLVMSSFSHSISLYLSHTLSLSFFLAGRDLERIHCDSAEKRTQSAGLHRRRPYRARPRSSATL